jgi:hypothetical protein
VTAIAWVEHLLTAGRVFLALVGAVVLYLLGAAMIRNLNDAPPVDDDEPTAVLEDVDYRFRCIVCSAEIVMYAAPEGEVPEPPRHCREPMLLMAPVE